MHGGVGESTLSVGSRVGQQMWLVMYILLVCCILRVYYVSLAA